MLTVHHSFSEHAFVFVVPNPKSTSEGMQHDLCFTEDMKEDNM